MELSLLSIFADVMRQGSYAKVARSRGVTPSAISRAVTALEDQLGLLLFTRTTRRIRPTEGGIAYFEHIERVLAQLEEAKSVAKDFSSQPTGTVRITAPIAFGNVGIVPMLPDFLARHPEIELDVRLCDEEVDILADRVDVAVRLGRMPDSGLIAKRLAPIGYVLCASPRYLYGRGVPKAPADLQAHDAVVMLHSGRASRWHFQGASAEEACMSIAAKVRLSNESAVHRCAVAGLGVALLPRWVAHRSLQAGKLVHLLSDYVVAPHEFEATAWLVYPSRRHVPARVRLFIDFLAERFKAGPPWESEGRPRAAPAVHAGYVECRRLALPVARRAPLLSEADAFLVPAPPSLGQHLEGSMDGGQ